MSTQEIAVIESSKMSLSAQDIKAQVQRIQEMMAAVMQDGTHYGKIPGCGPKPTLLKAGAEKLASTFRLAPDYVAVSETEVDDFISYKIRCTLTHIPTGMIAGAGLGACNSRERKYRNNAPWDVQNTLLKMACKRALVAAVLNATAASDIFTQDLEDIDPKEVNSKPVSTPVAQAEKDFNEVFNPPPAAAKGNGCISDAQRKRFYAIYKSAGITDEVAKQYLQKNYGFSATAEIKRENYEDICDWAQFYKQDHEEAPGA